METFCPVLSGDPALLYVDAGHEMFTNLAQRTYDLTVQQATRAFDFHATPFAFNISFDFNGQLTPFHRPAQPSIDDSAFDMRIVETPGLPANFDAHTLNPLPLPVADLTPPTLSFPARPTAPAIVAPTAPGRPAALVMPDSPDYVLPPLPTFEELNLPAVPVITLPMFDSTRPEFVEPTINENWSFSPEAYTSALLTKLQAKTSTMLDGGRALPAAIERALFDDGRGRIVIETESEVENAFDEFSERGFSSPPGMLAARVDGIRQAGQNRIADYSRGVGIKAFEEALANMRLALQQGIALEGVAVNLHIEQQRLLLTSAQFLRETTMALFNARVTVYQARLDGYRTDASVLAERIRAELAKVEVFRAQIEGERARGEINAQRVSLYAEQVRAVGVMADFYRTQVQTVEVQANAQRAVVETYKAEVDAYGTRWDAFAKEYDGYKAAIEAENIKSNVHRNLVDAYGTRVLAVKNGNDSLFEGERLRMAAHQQGLNVYMAQLERIRALLQAENTRLTAVSSGANAKATMYRAAADVEQAASAASDRTFQLGLARAQAEVDTGLKTAEIKVQENIQLTALMLDLNKMLTTVLAQLSASSMSAVNYSASVSSSQGTTRQCSTSLTYSGEAPDLS